MPLRPIRDEHGSQIFVCNECWRCVSTYERRSADGVLRMQVPFPHHNGDGEPCDGIDQEAISPWE